MSGILRLLLAVLFVFPFSISSFADDEATVEFFSPQGTVKGVRQVNARFSEPMVPFGDPRITSPFDISCIEKGQGRWADAKNWVFDFERDLPAGIKCEFRTKADLKSLSGKAVRQQAFSFSTGGPAIIKSNPREGSEYVNEDQIFILNLDSAAAEESILANASFYIVGMEARVGINIINGEPRKQLLKANYRKDEPNIVLIQCKQKFPADTEVRLVWGKGITSITGVSTEMDQTLAFKTRKPFVANFSCMRERKDAQCIPMLPMDINFSGQVPWETARKIRLKGQGKTYKPAPGSGRYGGEYEDEDESGEGEPSEDKSKKKPEFVSSVTFKGPFPEKSSFVIEMPKNVKDDAGRTLTNADRYPLTVRTDYYPPLAKFSSRFGIIELKGDATLPVTLRNLEAQVKTRMLKVEENKGAMNKAKEGVLNGMVKLGEKITSILPESMKPKSDGMVDGLKGRLHKIRMDREGKIIEWLRNVRMAERQRSILKGSSEVKEFGVPKPGGEKAFEVVGIPLKEPELYIVEMESQILGTSLLGDISDEKGRVLQKQPMYVPTAALVTNLSVHFKKGRESSIVWVTTLDKAKPVNNASVTIRDCTGKAIWSGKTDSRGIASIAKPLPEPLPHCRSSERAENYYDSSQLQALQVLNDGLFVFAKKDGDLSFVHSNWKEGIEPWRFNIHYYEYGGPVIAHTVFDRTLLRAGETVHMKHLIRKHTMSGFGMLAPSELPDKAVVEHIGSEKTYEFPLKWDGSGVSETTWQIPKDAKLGHYSVRLERPEKQTAKKRRFNRETWNSGSFRVEEFRVPLMKAVIQPPKGPVVNASEVDTDLMISYLSGGGAANSDVKLRSVVQPRYVRFDDYDEFMFANGSVKEGIERYSNRRYYGEEDEETGETRTSKKPKIITSNLTLGPSGALRTKIGPLPKAETPQDLAIEMEFKDPNGEVQTVSSTIPLWSSKLVVGIKPDSWAASKESFKFHVVALDLNGKPVSGVPVKADLFQRKNYSHRKRLIGGFYSYEHMTETKKIGSVCQGTTDAKGLVICDVKSPVSGNIIVQASAADPEGNMSMANREIWVYGKGDWWFDVSDNDRIDLLPEKKRYEPGETAKFQVRMPFRSATVLVTIEREGVMESFIKRLSGKNPVLEIPVKRNYAPNVFISALCVRGRVAGVKPTALIDLGKPAFKLGIAEIKVGWKAHELKVDVSSSADVYKIRQKVPVTIKVKKADGKLLPKGSEVAVAAVDEGLLELMPNKSWNLLESMMGRRGYEVETASAQMQVVGKRHYGLKALPHGGGGGKQTTRELFDTLLIWKGRVKLNEHGEASVEVPLNDSLTSFRIVAIANSGTGLFGTGSTSVRATQDLMLMSGIPQLVREGDSFAAGFTVRNASKRNMEITVTASSSAAKELDAINLSLQPGEAKEIAWNLAVPHGIDSISWQVSATEKSGEAADALKVTQKVIPAVRVSTYQATITQVKDTVSMQVERPKDAAPGRGGIDVLLRPKLAEGLNGIEEYMSWYPYTCFEQKTSIAIALRNEALWKRVVSEMPSHMDSEGLLKYFPSMLLGSDSLTAYVLSISAEAGWTIPDHLRDRMIEGLNGFINGKVIRYSTLPTADLSIRKMAAVEALSRYQEIRPELLSSISIEPNLWPTSAVIDWMNVLNRSRRLPNNSARLKEAEQILRSRLNFQGTTMGFSTEQSDYLWWLMVGTDSNAVKTVLTLLNTDTWNEDMPRLIIGAVGRQHRGSWGTTVANAWGVLALEKFSRKYESVPVSGNTSAALAQQKKSVDWPKAGKGGSMMLKWPKGKENLTITHQGTGKPWAIIRSLAAIPLKEPLSSGYKIKKSLTPVMQKVKGKWSSGDVVRVKLELEAQSDMTWVVVNDPVPAGSSILGSGLGRDSQMLTREEKSTGWVWPAFEERSFEAFRAYYEYVPKGKWSVEYTVRLNNEGSFVLPETRVEALYAPEMFGMMPNRKFEVGK